MALVLKEHHSFMQKVNKLYEEMEKLGINIEYGGASGLCIIDTENNNTAYRLLDSGNNENLSYFPTGTEFKLAIQD